MSLALALNSIRQEQFLSLRLSSDDSALMEQLHARMGLSKTEIVKRALRELAHSTTAHQQVHLFEMGQPFFGKYGDASRQSREIKSVVKAKLAAKRLASQRLA